MVLTKGSTLGINQLWEVTPVQDTYQVTGQTDVYYDPTYNQVVATGSTDADYSTQYYYGNRIVTQILDNGNLVTQSTWGFDGDQQGFGSTVAVVSNPAAGHTYLGYSVFQLVQTYKEYQVNSGCGSYCNYWYDPYYYSAIESDPQGTTDPTFGTTVWAPPLVITAVSVAQVLSTGSNGASTSVPGNRDYFDLKFRSFIPAAWIKGAGYPTDFCTDSGDAYHTPVYLGDHRSYDPFSKSYRSHEEVAVLASTGQAVSQVVSLAGTTTRYSDDAIAADGYTLVGDSVLHDCHLTDDIEPGSISASASVTGGGGQVTANLYGNATNMATTWGPYATPSIDWNVTYTINAAQNPSTPAYTFQYTHDCFPAYEAFIGTQRIYGYKPNNYSASSIGYCLAGGSQVQDSTIGTVN